MTRVHAGASVAILSDAAIPAAPPAAGAGADLSPVKSGGTSRRYQMIQIDKTAGVGAGTITGPVEVYLEHGGKVRKFGELNGGANIDLPDGGPGYQEILEFLGLGTHVAIVAPSGFTPAGLQVDITLHEVDAP